MIRLKKGYVEVILRQIVLGDIYVFTQIYEDDESKTSEGEIRVINSDGSMSALGAYFDPLGRNTNIWGSPASSVEMNFEDRSAHIKQATSFFKTWKGSKLFQELPFEPHYYRKGMVGEVPADEAIKKTRRK